LASLTARSALSQLKPCARISTASIDCSVRLRPALLLFVVPELNGCGS
jgi:hypothetical protein